MSVGILHLHVYALRMYNVYTCANSQEGPLVYHICICICIGSAFMNMCQ